MEIDLPIADAILQFTVLITAALVVQLTVERLHLPGIVGLLTIGMVIGPGGVGLLPHGPVVELLGTVGLVYIMFLAGMEMDLEVGRTHRRETVVFGVLAFGISFLLAVGAGLMLDFGWAAALLLGAALASHTLMAYPIVAKLRLLHRPPVVAAIGGTLLTDTLALVLLAVVVQQAAEATGLIEGALPLLLLVAIVAISLFVLPRLARSFFRQTGPSGAEKALFVLALLMILSSLTEFTGTEAILGAFLAGICLNRPLHERKDLREHVEFVGRMLFIPFFFVETGMRLELAVFTERMEVWLLAGLLLSAVVVGKVGAAVITGHLFEYRWVDRILMVGLTLPQAAATLAVTLTAREVGVIGEEVVDAVIIVIFLTCLAGPLITRFAGNRISHLKLKVEDEGPHHETP